MFIVQPVTRLFSSVCVWLLRLNTAQWLFSSKTMWSYKVELLSHQLFLLAIFLSVGLACLCTFLEEMGIFEMKTWNDIMRQINLYGIDV